jgi:hypothetical protein
MEKRFFSYLLARPVRFIKSSSGVSPGLEPTPHTFSSHSTGQQFTLQRSATIGLNVVDFRE